MASYIKKGESVLIPFRNGQSISDSQLKPRMYKTMQAFERAFPKHYLGTDGVKLVEYAEVVRCKDCGAYNTDGCAEGFGWCVFCDRGMMDNDYCSHGGRRTDG